MDHHTHTDLDYYRYYEKRREEYVDLTQEENLIVELANQIFSKNLNDLDLEKTGILIHDEMSTEDLYCMLIDLTLRGLEILTKGEASIFLLKSVNDNILRIINSYLNSSGFELLIQKTDTIPDNYLYEIKEKPCQIITCCDWCVLDYRLIYNKNKQYNINCKLNQYTSFFETEGNEIFTIKFKHLFE